MGIIADRPLWQKNSVSADWVEHENAEDFDEYDASENEGWSNQEFLDELLIFAISDNDAYDHEGESVHPNTIWIAIGTIDGFENGLGSHYDYKTLDSVSAAFGLGEDEEAIDGEHLDMYFALSEAGYDLGTEYAQAIFDKLQAFVDQARSDEDI